MSDTTPELDPEDNIEPDVVVADGVQDEDAEQ